MNSTKRRGKIVCAPGTHEAVNGCSSVSPQTLNTITYYRDLNSIKDLVRRYARDEDGSIDQPCRKRIKKRRPRPTCPSAPVHSQPPPPPPAPPCKPRAVTLPPKTPRTHIHNATVLRRKHRFQEALAVYERAEQIRMQERAAHATQRAGDVRPRCQRETLPRNPTTKAPWKSAASAPMHANSARYEHFSGGLLPLLRPKAKIRTPKPFEDGLKDLRAQTFYMQDSITPRAQRESIFQEHCHDMMKPREWGYATLTREFDKRFWSLQPSLLVGQETRSEQHVRSLLGREREAVRKRRKAQKKLHEYHLTFRAMARGAHHFALLCIQCWGSRALRRKIIRERNYGAAHRAARRLGVLQHSIQRLCYLGVSVALGVWRSRAGKAQKTRAGLQGAVKTIEAMKRLAAQTLESLLARLELKSGKAITLREFRLRLAPEQAQPLNVADSPQRNRKRRQSWFETTTHGSDAGVAEFVVWALKGSMKKIRELCAGGAGGRLGQLELRTAVEHWAEENHRAAIEREAAVTAARYRDRQAKQRLKPQRVQKRIKAAWISVFTEFRERAPEYLLAQRMNLGVFAQAVVDCSDAAYQEILISIKQIAAGRKMMKAIHQPAKRFDANGKELPREKKTLSAAEMKEARMVFDRFDSDGGGSLGIQEMLGALKQMGVYGYNAADVEAALARIDANNDGEVDFLEFVEFLAGNV